MSIYSVMKLRTVEPRDLDQVREIFIASWLQANPSIQLNEFDPRSQQLAPTVVCERNGDLAGFFQLQAPWLRRLYVAPQHQRRGVGRVLMAEAVSRGARILEVEEDNATARAFYEQVGWVWNGFRAPSFKNPQRQILTYERLR